MSEFRVSLLQFGVALTGALLFLVVAAVLIRGLHPALECGLIWVRPGFQRLDRALALTVARWIGLDEEGRARRWGRLLTVLLGAGAVGALLPPQLGAPVLVLGLVAVLAVFRRWAWDEEDRAAGVRSDRRRTPGSEDYNNELLVALSAVFMLGSLLVWRLTGLHVFSAASRIGGLEYVTYVASEALEALPIVGNIEVMGYDNPSGVQAVLPTGGGVAFALRMGLDLLVIGGLLQALAVARRIATGQDLRRHEEALRAAETEERVDAALQEVADLAHRGNVAALALLEGIALPADGGARHEVFKRRAAADMLLNLYEGGSVIGVSGLNAAILTYDVLITSELQREVPLQWARSVAARAHAAYLLGMLLGGEQGRRRLIEAGDGFKLAAQSLSILQAPQLADRAELGYWAVQVEALYQVEAIPPEHPPLLITDIQGFIDRMGPAGEAEVVEETRRLVARIATWMLSRGMTPPAVSAVTPGTPLAQLDQAAATIQQFGREPSEDALERLDRTIRSLETLYAQAQAAAVRSDAALRLAQAWSARARAVVSSRQDALRQIDRWCEALGPETSKAPRVRAVVREIQANCFVMEASTTPFGPKREALAERAIETYRQLVNAPDLREDPLSIEARANMAIALLNFAKGARPDRARIRLEEAAQLADSLRETPDPTARASAALTGANVRRDLALLKPEDQRGEVLDQAIRDAKTAVDGYAGLGNEEGRLLAMRALGFAHMDQAVLEGYGPEADRHAREAFPALEFTVAHLDRERNPSSWFEAAHAFSKLAADLGVQDRDRDKLITARALLAELRQLCIGPLEAQAPYVEKAAAAVERTLGDWDRQA
ncbi:MULTISPECIES: hypothetical protein [unclassified Brevundimonas]|uniref:hypothetical protein n=1 Tax=unclassified Brevundimonas TaxID=2622653 RepID=UPI000CFCC266|nr:MULTISPECIES: hypothetical protein [unclassified Brevundimonas]PRA33570.1 hypothetical protein CQ024_04215 [Brevundimonas sp. MYb27]PQZ81786.1 hypothetical protein CQ026_08690 [Brevundimonas sp. MYb31]PRB13363.1 hypothetical protein CQ039_12815 [Brevundimonas sp. MYb52]PRB34012.1 hypothetical protein CQ035_11830 [Brevundimonas sp. MYb46]PRB52700.1 hypothetical protein CQ028_05935 [Brevundimonas sp. MYb33]